MSKEYNKLAADILAAVGGKKNVVSLRHCITRLRFVLKDEKIAKDDVLKNMEGVATVVKSAGEYMVVIGEHVHSVFEEVCAHMGVDGTTRNEIIISKEKGRLLGRALDIVMGAMGPTLNLMCACGILKGILAILALLGIPQDSGFYQLINAGGDCFFYFMPLLLGYNVARKLNIDPAFGFILAAALCYPTIQGVDLNFHGYVVNATYTSTFLPIIFGVVVAVPIYKFFEKHISEMVKGFAVPLLTLLISFPLTFCVVGPLANLVGMGINTVLTVIIGVSPALAGILLGGFYQLMVLFGVHAIPMTFAFMDFLQGNPPSLIFSLIGGASYAVMGTVLAVYLRTKNKELKNIALPAFFSSVFGVTEPAVYGVLLPNVNTFVFTSIGAAVGGFIAGILDLRLHAFTGMGFIGLLGFLNPDGPTNFLGVALIVLAPCIVGFVLTFLFFKDKSPDVEAVPVTEPVSVNRNHASINKKFVLAAPMAGEVRPLSACRDEAFSSEALGKGCVIYPAEGRVVAPCDGEVSRLFETNHAVGLTTPDGVEILIHIGMDTIRLDGKYFSAHVKQGDKVSKGQLLITFDQKAIENEGYITETPMVITNTDDFLDVIETVEGTVQTGADLLTVLM